MDTNLKRRAFVKYLALGSASITAASYGAVNDKPKAQTKKPNFGMIFDQNKCVGCTDCERACVKVNLVPKGQMRLFVEDKTDPNNRMQKRYVRVSCQQCVEAPCASVCPTNACHKDLLTGITTTNADDCIACKYCIVACPYDVRFINSENHAAESCNFCLDTNLAEGKEPACVEACRYDALVFGDLNDEESHISKLLRIKDSLRMRPECGTKPSLRYIPAVKMGV
ncbi:4Fe-4S dicluster domain-containing protein [Campylobacter sp. RM9344]|uniref:4Fe-4S dicluster domain-containing protein n=1 Tax=Campylobacter californiensis TaxID=1032243 RepID=A0AAW3ZX53_9BACT|nr:MULTISPECIES: 4Fe-4S dicluster domain-containing protein [unclassified Campylobacter]MBE2983820.1 4Fe-4S dicluster domain-containing protein [Campylobacter sp. RM6883]MBE2994358.1 4Fe-4S dicluster domain-containing protein [Campylobacter sp. RM6913]MBE3028666.1 4Fe-4S dicluster domain-containing protein [Campylobacter sp. RM9344]MBE3605426.1 4Fe-4S dicluster domain-containing protein [Campylobacter sp. RM13119]MBE3607555.1 4Fe-4S dicluster domain-containing protein [Campylobacter sp. RM9337